MEGIKKGDDFRTHCISRRCEEKRATRLQGWKRYATLLRYIALHQKI